MTMLIQLQSLKRSKRRINKLKEDTVNIKVANTIDDLVANFLYYDRKGDEVLRLGQIENQLKKGTLSIDEIVLRFKQQLINGIKENL